MITLLTDFGLDDPYVGVMKGVLLTRCPAARLVDLTHSIQPQNVAQTAFLLEHAFPYFPAGTVHLCVVDPGVGSARRGLAAQVAESFVVGPDNGFAAPLLQGQSCKVVELSPAALRLPEPSHTFHGRDLFAPVAAHLANGGDLDALGVPLTDPVPLACPTPRFEGPAVHGAVRHVDRFGNLITDLDLRRLKAHFGDALEHLSLQVEEVVVDRQVTHYAEAPPGQPVLLVGSFGTLEVALNSGNAAAALGAKIGDSVTVAAAKDLG